MIIAFVRFSLLRGLAVFFLISGTVGISCYAASYMAVHPEPINIKTIIAPGDIVRVTTKDNRKVEFEVVEVTDEAIIGDNETIDFTNISKLEEMTATGDEKFIMEFKAELERGAIPSCSLSASP